MVDADLLHDVVDVIDEVLDGRRAAAAETSRSSVALVELGPRSSLSCASALPVRALAAAGPRAPRLAPLRRPAAALRGRGAHRRRPAAASAPAAERRARPAGRTPCAAPRAPRALGRVESSRSSLNATACTTPPFFFSASSCSSSRLRLWLHKCARRRMRRDDRRLRQRQRLHHRLLRRMRDVDHDADPVHLGDDLLAERATGRSTSSLPPRRCSSRRAGCGRCAPATCSARRDRRTP